MANFDSILSSSDDIESILNDDNPVDSVEDMFGDSPAGQKRGGSFTVATRIGSDKIEYLKNSATGKVISSAEAKAIFLAMAQSVKVNSSVKDVQMGDDVLTADDIKAIFMAITHYVAEKIIINS